MAELALAVTFSVKHLLQNTAREVSAALLRTGKLLAPRVAVRDEAVGRSERGDRGVGSGFLIFRLLSGAAPRRRPGRPARRGPPGAAAGRWFCFSLSAG